MLLRDRFRYVGIAALLATLGTGSACAQTDGPGAAAPPAAVQGSANAAVSGDVGSYRLGVADKVRIIVFNEPTLSGEFTVSGTGKLSLPLIGEVDAVGKQTSELAAIIQSSLRNGYLNNPRVSAEIVQFRPFYILGEVRSPGQYPYAIGLTVYNAIATAQGFTPRADRKSVFIRKENEDREQRQKLSPDLKIYPGDTVRIGERYF